jgi:hypothetical protein
MTKPNCKNESFLRVVNHWQYGARYLCGNYVLCRLACLGWGIRNLNKLQCFCGLIIVASLLERLGALFSFGARASLLIVFFHASKFSMSRNINLWVNKDT